MQKFTVCLLAMILMMSLFAGCGDKTQSSPSTSSAATGSSAADSPAPPKTYSLKVSGIGGSVSYMPIYVAQEKGWFEEAGLDVEEVLFTTGPVQMEALSSNAWDISLTGAGGVFAGVIGYDALVVGASNTNDGSQYIFARNDSDIVAAGQGNNSLGKEIYGDAASWSGKRVLCNTGTVPHFVLNRTLQGFGMSPDEVTLVVMDATTGYSSFLAGEGDVVVLTGSGGAFKMLGDAENYTAISNGVQADTGLFNNFVANKNSYQDPEKYEAMKLFMSVYFETATWMSENLDDAVEYMVAYGEENGVSTDAEAARMNLQADRYFSLQEAADMINTMADGKDYSVMDDKLLSVLTFFMEYGNYELGSDEKYMGHTDSKLLNDVLSMQ